jgi:hypothetical protein
VAELVWTGKGRAPADVAPRPICTDEVHGTRAVAWHNRLILGEAERVLRALAAELRGKVALVVIDPPFDTGGSFDYLASIPGAPEGAPRIAVPAYRDARGLDAWLGWFFDTAVLLRDLLAEGGSLYVHLDSHAAHYAKVLLDEVFGREAFQREIVWRIGWVSGFKSRARGWIRNHDTLLFYAKGGRPATFHKEYVPYPPGYVRRDGAPPKGLGYPIEDVWNASEFDRMDSIQIVSFSREKVGYPTQKNESLLSRIVRASSSPGDLVLDCFVGSGTTAVVAERLGRRWVACDAGPLAIHATRRRLLVKGTPRPFVVQNVEGSAEPGRPRRFSATAACDGYHGTIELTTFALPMRAVPRPARAAARHWSQWIDGWCVDWDYEGGPLRSGSRVWRARGKDDLALSVSHRYRGRGRRVALVKVFDVLGGATTAALEIDVQ